MKSGEISLGACGGRILTGEGYRFTQDSVLLANLMTAGSRDRLLDLGCGGGVISVLALLKKGVREAVGLDNDAAAVELYGRNAELNGLSDRMRGVCADVRAAESALGGEVFDKAAVNPPYYDFDDGTGALDPHKRESGAVLADFVAAAAALLKNGGDLFLVHKADRLIDALTLLRGAGLEPKRLHFVFPRPGSPADIFVVAARKGGGKGLTVRSLTVTDERGERTREIKELYSDG